MTFPFLSTKNFSKFHWISASPAGSGNAVSSEYSGVWCEPLTSTFSKIGKEMPYVVEQNSVVGLCDAQKLLHGKRGQAHLAAADPGPFRDMPVDVQ